MGEVVARGDPLVRETLLEEEGYQPLPQAEGDPLTLPPKVSSRVKRELHPLLLPALALPTRAGTPRRVG